MPIKELYELVNEKVLYKNESQYFTYKKDSIGKIGNFEKVGLKKSPPNVKIINTSSYKKGSSTPSPN